MAITQAICTSFKSELLQGIHNFAASGGDTFKLALYSSSASLGASTTAYTATGEITGTNYTAGGSALTNIDPITDGTMVIIDFTDLTFSNVTISGVRGALIYNSTDSNRAVCVVDFGSDYGATAQNFTITFPPPTTAVGFLRFP